MKAVFWLAPKLLVMQLAERCANAENVLALIALPQFRHWWKPTSRRQKERVISWCQRYHVLFVSIAPKKLSRRMERANYVSMQTRQNRRFAKCVRSNSSIGFLEGTPLSHVFTGSINQVDKWEWVHVYWSLQKLKRSQLIQSLSYTLGRWWLFVLTLFCWRWHYASKLFTCQHRVWDAQWVKPLNKQLFDANSES